MNRLIVWALLAASPAMGSLAFKRSLTVNHALCGSSDSSNFPVIVRISDPAFKAAANGGHIYNTVIQSGGNAVNMPADMMFTSDSAGASTIPWEVESYDAVNGVLLAWVKVAALSHTADTTFYVFYGDAQTTTQQNTGGNSPANVWSNGFAGVWHLPGPALSVNDSTSNANNGIVAGGVTSTTGQLDGAASLTGGANIVVPYNATLNLTSGFTLSVWANPSSLGASTQALIGKTNNDYFLGLSNACGSCLYVTINGSGPGIVVPTSGPAANAWNYLVMTVSGAAIIVYLNGSLVYTGYVGYLPPFDGQNVVLGGWSGGAIPFTGSLDEARLAGAVRSPDWITAEYNNQSSPSTFLSVGSEASSTASLLPPSVTRHKVVSQ